MELFINRFLFHVNCSTINSYVYFKYTFSLNLDFSVFLFKCIIRYSQGRFTFLVEP